MLSKRASTKQQWRVIFREPLVWAVAPAHAHLAARRPLPLAMHPEPSVSALARPDGVAFGGHRQPRRDDEHQHAGLRAAVVAGLGIGVFGNDFLPPVLERLPPGEASLPALPDLEFGLERRPGTPSPAVAALARILEEFDYGRRL